MMRQNRECVKIHSMFSLWISTLCCKVIVHQRRNIYIYLTKRAICIIFIYQVEFRLKFSFFFFSGCTRTRETDVQFMCNSLGKVYMLWGMLSEIQGKRYETQGNAVKLLSSRPQVFSVLIFALKTMGCQKIPLKNTNPAKYYADASSQINILTN